MDYVLHEEPEAFRRRGGRIDHCPCCPKHKAKHSAKERHRLAVIRELADLLGDDVDGLAGTLDDFGLL
jgi:hypothetical protein